MTVGEDVAARWRRYFEDLLNSENHSYFEETKLTEGPIMDINQEKWLELLAR